MKYFLSTLASFLLVVTCFSQNQLLKSPDGRLVLDISLKDQLSWKATLDGKVIIEEVKIGMNFSEGTDFGYQPKVSKASRKSGNELIRPAVPHKDSEIQDVYEELTLSMSGSYEVKFRAYNDGVAYQFIDLGKKSRQVINEDLVMTYPEGTGSLFPQEESMYSHNERLFLDRQLADIQANEFCSLPVMMKTAEAKVLFTETALHDYPGMFLKGNGNNSLQAIFPPYVLEAVPDEKNSPDRNQILIKKADYIAQVAGKRAFPWRVFVISDDDRTFVETNLTYQLAKPTVISNTSWIKPGKVAWDWYNANNLYGVDFKSGLNTASYKYYIDFASANHIEYVILDEGWTKSTTEILEFNPEMDVAELIRYGKSKNVELILWVLWKPLDENLTQILETYKSWGVKGVKVDFMQRNDQYMVSSYERIARECARLELLVDFHGAFKPSGLRRTYPNVINYEGVKGSENNKWSQDVSPEHNVTIPFTRMVAGPMDYTPGAMVNKHLKNHGISFDRPESLGTRAHQVAMYTVYEAPLQMLCESPSRYLKEQETVDYITRIPTVWDETVVLQAAVGDYLAVARRKGANWYIGAMTDWTGRELTIDFSFLGAGTYEAEIFADGINAGMFAEDYQKQSETISSASKLQIKLASGGGWSAIVKPVAN